MNKTIKSQRSKSIDIAILEFIKAVENSTTYDEVLSLAPSHKNLSKAILSESSNKNIAKSIIDNLHSMWFLKIRLIHQTK